jgi:hypothetical protein
MASELPARLNGGQTVRNGRDARGRFTPGNSGGRPANPFGRYQRELRGALLAAVRPGDLQAVTRTLVRLAKQGQGPSVELLLRWTLGGPPPSIDPDRLDEHELDVRRKRPTLLDQLSLVDDQADDPDGAPITADEVDADPLEPSLRTVLAWAIQELAETQTALRAQSPPPRDPAAGWEAFASDRLEWDAQAAVGVDHLYVEYAKWCAGHGEVALEEAQVVAALQAHGAIVHTGPLSQLTAVVGVRVVD